MALKECAFPGCGNTIVIKGLGESISGHDNKGNRVFMCSIEHLRDFEAWQRLLAEKENEPFLPGLEPENVLL